MRTFSPKQASAVPSGSPAIVPSMPIVTELPARAAAARHRPVGANTQQRNLSWVRLPLFME